MRDRIQKKSIHYGLNKQINAERGYKTSGSPLKLFIFSKLVVEVELRNILIIRIRIGTT